MQTFVRLHIIANQTAKNVTNQKRFLPTGEIVDLISETDSGYVVRRYVAPQDSDSELWGEFVDLVPHIYKELPTYKYSDRILELKSTIQALEKERESIAKLSRLAQKELSERRDKLVDYPQAQIMMDFLENKITHIAYTDGTYHIETLEDALEKDNGFPGNIRLVSLFGGSGGDLEWKVNKYSDGSGVWSGFVPARSEEEAQEAVRDHIKHALAGEYKSWMADSLIKSATKFGVEIPPVYLAAHKEQQTKTLKESLSKAEAQAESARTKLKELREL